VDRQLILLIDRVAGTQYLRRSRGAKGRVTAVTGCATTQRPGQGRVAYDGVNLVEVAIRQEVVQKSLPRRCYSSSPRPAQAGVLILLAPEVLVVAGGGLVDP